MINHPNRSKKTKQEVVIAYKGFDKDFKCRGFQFEVGKTYECEGTIKACKNGFHACANPFDVLAYYGLFESRFAQVELSGALDRHAEDSKIAAAKITVSVELTLPAFLQKAINWVINVTKNKNDDSSGYNARIGSSGHNAQIGSSGHDAKIGSSGNYAQIGSSGNYAQIGSSGDSAKIGSSGYNARIGSSGYNARIGSSGHDAQIGSSGHDAKIGSSGNYAQIEATGELAVIASAGPATRVRGKVGAWISLAEYANGKCVGFATGCIGQCGLKPDTWYIAKGGKLMEIDE